VLAVLAGELSIAEAARKEQVSEQSIGRWKAEFVEAGKTALTAGKTGPSTREARLEAEVVELTQALGEAAVDLRVWKKSAEGRLGPLRAHRNRGCSGRRVGAGVEVEASRGWKFSHRPSRKTSTCLTLPSRALT
jgi:transposase